MISTRGVNKANAESTSRPIQKQIDANFISIRLNGWVMEHSKAIPNLATKS